MKLTIAIPTYNRNEILLGNLRSLLPQLTSDCKLLILDNCSPTPVEETLRELLAEFPGVNYEIRRNRVNIGGIANVTRCFEACETPWLWTLSDDDRVKSNAIERIFEYLERYPDCVFFNFGVEHHRPRSKTVVTRGAEEFVRNIDSFGNTIFISSGVYRADVVVSGLKYAYHYAYTMAPQFVTMLKSLDAQSVCCLSHEPIVEFVKPPLEHQWARLNIALGIPTLLELPLEPPVRDALAEKIVDFAGEYLPHTTLVYQLMLSGVENKDTRGPLHLYDQVCARQYYFDHRIGRKITVPLYRLLLRFPGPGYKITAWAYRRLRREESGTHKLQNRTERL